MSDRLKQILTELRRQMNGAISQTMRELGQNDSLNFGVSLPTIKQIATNYAPDHELACLLSSRKSREARIAALYVANPQELTLEQMQQWSEQWHNQEIARLSAMLLFHKSPDAAAAAKSWIGTTPLRNLAALYIIGKICTQIEESVLERVLESTDTDDATTFCMREIYNACPQYREAIKTIALGNSELEWQLN